jgi:hypothetical protein
MTASVSAILGSKGLSFEVAAPEFVRMRLASILDMVRVGDQSSAKGNFWAD